MSKSVFELSRELFGSPSRTLSFIRDHHNSMLPFKENITWEELGQVIDESIEGKNELSITRPTTPTGSSLSPWERLCAQNKFALKKLAEKYPALLPGPDHMETTMTSLVDENNRLLLLCSMIHEELDSCVVSSKTKEEFEFFVLRNRNIQSHNMGEKKNLIPFFPLLNFFEKIKSTNGDQRIIQILLDSGITTSHNIGQFSNPVRRIIRDAVSQCIISEDSSNIYSLCERQDLILMNTQQTLNFFSQESISSPVMTLNLESDKCADLQITHHNFGDADQQRQRALLVNAHKVVSRQIGRGASTLFSDHERRFEMSPINLNGKFSSVGVVSLDLSLFPIDALFWPEFNNGVSYAITSCSAEQVSRETILRLKNSLGKDKKNELPLALHRHAGFLFGLFLLRKQDMASRMDDLYNYLKMQNESVSVSIILGSGIACKTTMDEKIAKIALLHIPSQLPDTHDLDLPPLVTSAALAALGFIYGGSVNRSVIEILLKEIRNKPIGDKPLLERECLIFSSAVSIGLICLAKGPETPSDIKLQDSLIDMTTSFASSSSGCEIIDNSARVSLLLENRALNTSLTLPGACIALALAFLGSSDRVVCDRIKIPSTHEQLETEPRSDSLLFKMIAKCLIMLDLIDPSVGWVEAQLPPFLQNPSLLESKEIRLPGADCPSVIDWAAVYQARMYAIAGIAIAIGIKYAGSQNILAKNVLIKILKSFINSTQWPANHCAAQSASRPSPSMALDRATVETCRAAALISLACVMAGSGDSECLEFAQKLRDSADEATPYGINVTVNQAAGFLALGNARWTFQNTPFAMACLLLAIVPRYPSGVSDNRASLHAFRHLFVLAVEKRSVEVVDIGTMQPTSHVPAKIIFNDKTEKILQLPTTLPRKCDFSEIVIESDRYEPVTVTDLRERIFLQKIPGKTSHATDAFGTLNADRAYISEFSEPSESEVRKLIGLPLGATDENNLDWFASQENQLLPTSRKDWRPTLAELAAVSWPRKNLCAVFKEFISCKALLANVEPFELSMSEKYAELLLPNAESSDRSRSDFIRLLDRCVKEGRVDIYLDQIEMRNS